MKNSGNGWMRVNPRGITVLGGSTCPTKVPSEGTNPCTKSCLATKNVFDVLQDFSESIRGSSGPQLDAADGLLEPTTHHPHRSLIELLEMPENPSLHAVRRIGRQRQLHLKIRALFEKVEWVLNVLVDTGAQVLSGLAYFNQSVLSQVRDPSGQYMAGTTKAKIVLQFMTNGELSRPDLGTEILRKGKFYKVQMDWDMIVGYGCLMERGSGLCDPVPGRRTFLAIVTRTPCGMPKDAP